MKKDKAVTAIVGVAIMVVITVIIAAAVYVYVSGEQKKTETGKNIIFAIQNYSVAKNGSISFTAGFENDNDATPANMTIKIKALIINNRIETNHLYLKTMVLDFTIQPGLTSQKFNDIFPIGQNSTYVAEVTLETQYKTYPTQSLYFFKQ